METPFNENLVLSSLGCGNPVLNPLLLCSSSGITPFSPGWRNEFHAGIQQAFGKYVVFSGEYIWKYTHNAYDFSVLGATPITFPIEWDHSKIPGYAGRVSVPNLHGFSALMVFSSVAARFFTPQIGGEQIQHWKKKVWPALKKSPPPRAHPRLHRRKRAEPAAASLSHCAAVNPAVQIGEPIFQSGLILFPCDAIRPRG